MKRQRSNFHKRRFVREEDTHFYTKEDIFISRMASILQVPKNKITGIFSHRAITTIRLNGLKGNTESTRLSLIKKGYDLEEIPFGKDIYFVRNRDKAEISQTEEYQNGQFYIQDLASILSALILDPKENEKILDMCAAPGSKTTHIADITNNKSVILANDIDLGRSNSLEKVVQQFGAKSAKVTLSDGKDFGKKYPDYFDRVLLDAPCSGEGRIYMNSDKPLRFWTIKKVKSCMFMQRDLIESAFRTLKPGGTLVYSTCTLEPEENEGIISYLIGKYPNAKVETIDLVKTDGFRKFKNMTTEGITKWSGNTYNSEVRKTLRILPSPEMMGFYIAKISKGSA